MGKFCFWLLCICASFHLNAASIFLHTKTATVWLPQQHISGNVEGLNDKILLVHFNDSSFTIAIRDEKFDIDILLRQKQNSIWVETINEKNHIVSDTIFYELGYKPLPLVVPYATVKHDSIFLHADVKSNPYNLLLRFVWNGDKRNPSKVIINNNQDRETNCVLPSEKGSYYFNLTVIAGDDSVRYKTFVTRSNSIHCFNIKTDHAAWIDSAVMYEITPHQFTEKGNYKSITEKLPELKQLGINCIWLQPLYQTHYGHQGYDVTDFFALRTDLGSEADLQELIAISKQLNIKVLFDFVPNHTSTFHSYAQDAVANKTNSHYYNFYQHINDGKPYSSLYEQDSLGFYHYFWKHLINLNYDNEEVQQWIIEACKYWLTKYDLDGFRFDAMWAVRARNASFGLKLQTALKTIKPDILLLSEDKGEDVKSYTAGYDAAYDWRSDTSWISRWSWQTDYTEQNDSTIFNFYDENKRGEKLMKALFGGDTTHLRLRFMENNDLPTFIKYHGLQRTKMVAAFMFALPGIPLIYNGQEIGRNTKLYSTKPIFKSGSGIQSLDSNGLFNYYQQLIKLRNKYASMRSNHMQNLSFRGAGSLISLYRWSDDEKLIVVMNMSKNAQPINIDISHINQNNKLNFIDVLNGETYTSSSNFLQINMPSYSTKLLLCKE